MIEGSKEKNDEIFFAEDVLCPSTVFSAWLYGKRSQRNRHKAVAREMKINAHMIRINPTPVQEQDFVKACGAARFAHNGGISRWKERLNAKKKTNWRDVRKEFNHEVKPENPGIREVNRSATALAFHDLGDAMNHFFDRKKGRRKERKVAFPRDKSKHRSKDSFRLESDNVRLNEEKYEVWVSHLGWASTRE